MFSARHCGQYAFIIGTAEPDDAADDGEATASVDIAGSAANHTHRTTHGLIARQYQLVDGRKSSHKTQKKFKTFKRRCGLCGL